MKTSDVRRSASILGHRGEFFRVLQQTSRTQCAVMTIAPGADGGPAEEHGGDQIVYVIEGEAVVRIGRPRARGRRPARSSRSRPAPTITCATRGRRRCSS